MKVVDAARTGRPRDSRADREIIAAALHLLADEGFDRFSVEEVAVRSGVAKTTIYRRYARRDDLIRGALESLNDDLSERSVEGATRDRLVRILEGIRQAPGTIRGRVLMRAAAEGVTDPSVAALVHDRVLEPRREALRQVIRDGVAKGELRAGIDLEAVIPLLVGPMMHLGMWRMCDGVEDISVEAVVDLILSGLGSASAAR